MVSYAPRPAVTRSRDKDGGMNVLTKRRRVDPPRGAPPPQGTRVELALRAMQDTLPSTNTQQALQVDEWRIQLRESIVSGGYKNEVMEFKRSLGARAEAHGLHLELVKDSFNRDCVGVWLTRFKPVGKGDIPGDLLVSQHIKDHTNNYARGFWWAVNMLKQAHRETWTAC